MNACRADISHERQHDNLLCDYINKGIILNNLRWVYQMESVLAYRWGKLIYTLTQFFSCNFTSTLSSFFLFLIHLPAFFSTKDTLLFTYITMNLETFLKYDLIKKLMLLASNL